MKFFWKIFFTTMFISVACSAVAGYILINSNFRSLLDNEVQIAYDYGDIVYYSLEKELQETGAKWFQLLEDKNDTKDNTLKIIANVAQSISINNINQKITFGILDQEGNTIFSSLSDFFDKQTVLMLGEDHKGWTLKKTDTKVYLQAVRPGNFNNCIFYIETIRDVTFIFDNQQIQFDIHLKIMASTLVFAGMITFIFSKFLIKPIISLTNITKDIAAGNFSKRVGNRGDDEFAILSHNFNQMADELEEKMHRLKDEAEKKELFIGAFSHELKTPLTSIIGYADMIRRKEMDREKVHICANYIFTEGKRLETLSMRLLELIVLKNLEVQAVPTDINFLLDEVCKLFFNLYQQSGIALSCDIEAAVIPLEYELMKTVFINLIDNGRKSIDGGGQIHIKGKWHQEEYIVSVRDTGKGMEREVISKIKEAFYIADKSRARDQGGAGLGLAICDEILKRHGFDISFESIVNEGTTVMIRMKGGNHV